jgi:phosphonate utilization transcriptional regulator
MPRPKQAQPVQPTAHGAAIDLLREHSLTTLVQRELERKIVSGELAAGAKLNEAEIAGELRVSRGPVREACRALNQSGLVRTEKNRGVFVRQVTLEEAYEIYEVRAALDGLIGRLAAKRIQPAQLQRLREIVKRMHAASRALDADAYFPLNIEFHEVLGEAAGNRALLQNYQRIVNELNLYRREVIARSAESIPVSTRDHEEIVNAVAKGDEVLAGRLLFEHVLNGRERLHRVLQEPPAPATRPRARQRLKTVITNG